MRLPQTWFSGSAAPRTGKLRHWSQVEKFADSQGCLSASHVCFHPLWERDPTVHGPVLVQPVSDTWRRNRGRDGSGWKWRWRCQARGFSLCLQRIDCAALHKTCKRTFRIVSLQNCDSSLQIMWCHTQVLQQFAYYFVHKVYTECCQTAASMFDATVRCWGRKAFLANPSIFPKMMLCRSKWTHAATSTWHLLAVTVLMNGTIVNLPCLSFLLVSDVVSVLYQFLIDLTTKDWFPSSTSCRCQAGKCASRVLGGDNRGGHWQRNRVPGRAGCLQSASHPARDAGDPREAWLQWSLVSNCIFRLQWGYE